MQDSVINLSLERIYYGEAPSIKNLSIAYNYNVYSTFMDSLYENLNRFCGAKTKMSTEQMSDLSKTIFMNYPYMKISEMMLFFHRIKSGMYGVLYGSVDALNIGVWLIEFQKQRVSEMRKIERDQEETRMKLQREEWAKTSISRQEYESLKLLKQEQ